MDSLLGYVYEFMRLWVGLIFRNRLSCGPSPREGSRTPCTSWPLPQCPHHQGNVNTAQEAVRTRQLLLRGLFCERAVSHVSSRRRQEGAWGYWCPSVERCPTNCQIFCPENFLPGVYACTLEVQCIRIHKYGWVYYHNAFVCMCLRVIHTASRTHSTLVQLVMFFYACRATPLLVLYIFTFWRFCTLYQCLLVWMHVPLWCTPMCMCALAVILCLSASESVGCKLMYMHAQVRLFELEFL